MSTEEEKEFEKKIEKKIEENIEKNIEENIEGWCSGKNKKSVSDHSSAGVVWFLGLIGAAVYYIQYADGFWDGVLGVLKAFVWPAFLVYEAMKALGM